MKFLAITALTAGLFMGSAAVAQGISQSEKVSYALTLIDAGTEGTANSATGGAVTDETKKVRVKVTVSVPRKEGSSNYGGIINSANPVRLMYRKHRGPSTAFNGSISLMRDAPYKTDGTPDKSAYYPMPQKGTDGKPIRDPKALKYSAVSSGDTLNAAGVDYATYVYNGQSHDPARWEATYLSPPYDVDWMNPENMNPMIHSLLTGSGTYEWYASSRYGMSSFTRISPIQDIARAMSFSDIRLWTPLATDASTADLNNLVDPTSATSLGHTFEWRASAMPEVDGDPGWHIYRGSIGVNDMGSVGAQLLNVTGADSIGFRDYARIESPTYPDGIGSITFDALVSTQDSDNDQQLIVQRYVGTAWETVTTLDITEQGKTYTVDFEGTANSNARFRLVRKTILSSAGSANSLTMIVRNLLVRSAAPQAVFGKPAFTPTYPAYNTYDADGNPADKSLLVKFNVAGGDGVTVPRGYAATLDLRRRAEGDNNRSWKTADVAVMNFSDTTGDATLTSTFTRATLQTNDDGSVNADEGAFFLRAGKVVGLLPGVYDLALNYHVYGSFKAGRNIIDEHEIVAGVASTHEVEVENAVGVPEIENHPNVLDLREHDTGHEGVYLRVMYRSGTLDEEAPYTLETMDVPLLPSSREPHLWRADLARILKLEDETAVYAWGHVPSGNDAEPTFALGKLAFSVYAITESGTMWYGQRAATATGTIPPSMSVVPAFTETIRVAAEEDVVPIVLDIADLKTSHVMVELEFAADPRASTEASIRVAGSYWQDFNTWHATSDNFTQTEFRENLRNRVADFDCVVEEYEGEWNVTGGWIPDEGPLAETTSFTETFDVGRPGIDNYPFFMHNFADQSADNFASWGASSTWAEPKYLRKDKNANDARAKYIEFGSNAEIVLNRSFYRQSTDYLPDAQIRLRGQSYISPIETADGVELNGVGTVSFNLGISLPYDFSRRVHLLSSNPEDALDLTGYGFGASVQIPSNATSGYSVSYYLEEMTLENGRIFELRLTQIKYFPTSSSTVPEDAVVAELYQWLPAGSTREATRLPLARTDGSSLTDGYYRIGSSLNGNSYGLWVRNDGRIAVGLNSSSSLDSLSPQFISEGAVASDLTECVLSVGSADCRPVFSQFVRSTRASTDFSSGSLAIISKSQVGLSSTGDWRITEDASSTRVQITRQTPIAEEAGSVKIRAKNKTTGVYSDPIVYSTNKTSEKITVVVGAANSTLFIEPNGVNSNIFLDNISVTSWCGNDENRNNTGDPPRNMVPNFTDLGFIDDNGFAGVGLWICPKNKDQVAVAPSEYRGEQCLLMQRSRQNTSGNEVETEGITHTGSALALYTPYSNTGFGPVTFRYCIPKLDEFGGSGTLPSVYVMLQYRDSNSYSNNYLEGSARLNWENVSDPIELQNTAGEWRTASITPKKNDKELIGATGTLRLVMVIKSNSDDYDPYVYIDDFTVTDNATESAASWSAQNVKLTNEPVSRLYWKDRAPNPTAIPEEETFAAKSLLTQAMQFNDVTFGDDTDNEYSTCVLNSPPTPDGVGRVSFAARLTEENAKPVRLYILATESELDTEMVTDFKPVTYVEVTNTVYTVYDVDLSKYTTYYTKPNANLLPESSNTTETFTASDVRRIQLRAYLDGDNITTDDFGDSSENRKPNYGRILMDTLSVSSPVLPSLRVESVAFSNVAGRNIPEEFNRQSPLSQPITNSPSLRVMVELGHMQLLREDSIRVFVTLNPHHVDDSASIRKYISAADYKYKDVLGNTVSASPSRPIYAWNKAMRTNWSLKNWFKLGEAVEKVDPENSTAYTPEELTLAGLSYTIELTREGNGNYFFGDLSDFDVVKGLPANSLVQYNAWAVYKSEESDQWYSAQITPSTHTDFPWYFPRNLNLEIQEGDIDETEDNDATLFSPYYWVYSCLPGEVFINEFNLNDSTGVEFSVRSFVEICAPAGLDIGGWKIDATSAGTELNSIMAWTIPDKTTLASPAKGAVPEKRKTGSSSERSFYTVFTNAARDNLFYTEMVNGTETKMKGFIEETINAGIAADEWETATLTSDAVSIQLLRPTGGAEHIVVFSSDTQSDITLPVKPDSMDEVDELYEIYRTAYISKGFGSEWYQTFLEGSWNDYIDPAQSDAFGKIALLEKDLTQAEAHGRRLTKANFFPSKGINTNYCFDQTEELNFQPVQDVARSSYANSIATIDMGGMWVTRLNALDTDEVGGPLDLTELYGDTWNGSDNPVLTSRKNEPKLSDPPNNAKAPYTQVTPRQINLDQYLLKYSGLAQSVVVSEIGGNLLGTHELKLDTDEVRHAGRATPQSWSLNLSVSSVQLTYTALPFQQVDSVKMRLVDAKSGDPELDLAKIQKQVAHTITSTTPDAEGWVTLEVPENANSFVLSAALLKNKDGATPNQEERYNLEAKADFALNPASTAAGVITKVAPYCGGTLGGSGPSQPWWGSGFGFDVAYNDAEAQGAVLTGVIVTYPSPAGLKEQEWKGLHSTWAGLSLTYTPDPVNGVTQPETTVSLEGMEYETALDLLKNVFGPKAQTRFVEMKGATDGRLADMSLVGIVSDTYAKAVGYDEADPETYAKKEPAIPFCVWGVYSCSIQTASGTEKVSFLMPQASPAEKPEIFTYPSWYQPLEDLNAGYTADPADAATPADFSVPYFYLYSTPPQAAWVNEVNVHNGGTGSDPYAEIVMPNLRDGILNATPAVPQTTNAGWALASYAADGTHNGTAALTTATTNGSLSSSYTYNTIDIADSNALSAYVLMRPCGAAEGGVWIGVNAVNADGTTGNVVAPKEGELADNKWLADSDCYVVPGKNDATNAVGSVQLVGEVIYRNGVRSVSSDVAKRTEWDFAGETKNGPNGNDGIPPDIMPEWNQVTITSSLRNTVYGGVLCGYQVIPGFIDKTELVGKPSTDGAVSHTLGGADWVYDAALGKTMVLSYRPRTNYRFESIFLPPELIGQVMLVGADGALSQEAVATQVAALRAAATRNPDAPLTDWVRLGGQDVNKTYRAEVQYTSYTDENGGTKSVPTGEIRFNPNYVVSAPGEEEVLFGDLSNYVVTLVFVKEPASAQNRIEVAMGQGEVLSGAWLVSQTFWAKDETGEPDPEKGGDTVEKPIWSDSDGNVDGNYKNTLGWLHQPIVGDKLGMSAVINPELGLAGGKIGQTVDDVRNLMESPNAALRPFLVWTLIPKEKVPVDVFIGSGNASSDAAVSFFNNWALSKWIGGSPTVGDRNEISLAALRERLLTTKNSDSGFYSDAGIIPMTWNGFCAADRTRQTDSSIAPRADITLMSFRTMTEDQLATAKANASATGISDGDNLLPYTHEIDMSDETLWKDGAVLRFAIIIADAQLGNIYDCQELANFTSDDIPVYCPWYLPDVTANINRTTSTRNAGVSPFAWVYAIPRGGVWLNEIRPFTNYEDTTDQNGGIVSTATIPPAVELAMYASPLLNEVDPVTGAYVPDDNGNYVPKYSLDGWKLVMKTAPLDPLATPEMPLDWDTHSTNTVDLQGWVPSRRLKLAGPDDDPAYHDLDYYVVTDKSASFLTKVFGSDITTYGYPGGANATKDNFMWLQLGKDLFEKDLGTTLGYREKYENKGVVYAIALMRNNGVVVDEVLFYNNTKAIGNATVSAVEAAITSENTNYQVVGQVRGVLHTALPVSSDSAKDSSAQFAKAKSIIDGSYMYGWVVEAKSNQFLNTFFGANIWYPYSQPELDFELPTASATSLLTARILGGDANLSLAQGYADPMVGTTLAARYATGTPYVLSLSEWNRKWFALQSITKDGQDITSAMTLGTTYALNDAGLLSSTQSLIVDEATLAEDTDYALSFVYTPAAAKLVEAGDLNSEDDGFLKWLLSVDPDAVLKQTETDGVTAAEKYWLGLDSAVIDATDVKLAITSIGSYVEPIEPATDSQEEQTETLPTISVSLTNGGEPITELTGDGVLILIGKETMDGDWQYVRRLYADDINGESTLILRTPCTVFKVLLLSEAQAAEYKE